ncbi:hypothetical protein B0H12DRAFT_1074921 [Mycena haematopus]|nr:hypothetical protein B0H12DRAFT_1074921 [Mycena haematopus]
MGMDNLKDRREAVVARATVAKAVAVDLTNDARFNGPRDGRLPGCSGAPTQRAAVLATAVAEYEDKRIVWELHDHRCQQIHLCRVYPIAELQLLSFAGPMINRMKTRKSPENLSRDSLGLEHLSTEHGRRIANAGSDPTDADKVQARECRTRVLRLNNDQDPLNGTRKHAEV